MSLFSCTTLYRCKHVKELFFESLSAPIWGEKRCKGIAISDTGQIFSQLFLFKVINKPMKTRLILLNYNNLIALKNFQKKIRFSFKK